MRDSAYFHPETGQLTTFSSISLLINAAWIAWRMLVCASAFGGLLAMLGASSLQRKRDEYTFAAEDDVEDPSALPKRSELIESSKIHAKDAEAQKNVTAVPPISNSNRLSATYLMQSHSSVSVPRRSTSLVRPQINGDLGVKQPSESTQLPAQYARASLGEPSNNPQPYSDINQPLQIPSTTVVSSDFDVKKSADWQSRVEERLSILMFNCRPRVASESTLTPFYDPQIAPAFDHVYSSKEARQLRAPSHGHRQPQVGTQSESSPRLSAADVTRPRMSIASIPRINLPSEEFPSIREGRHVDGSQDAIELFRLDSWTPPATGAAHPSAIATSARQHRNAPRERTSQSEDSGIKSPEDSASKLTTTGDRPGRATEKEADHTLNPAGQIDGSAKSTAHSESEGKHKHDQKASGGTSGLGTLAASSLSSLSDTARSALARTSFDSPFSRRSNETQRARYSSETPTGRRSIDVQGNRRSIDAEGRSTTSPPTAAQTEGGAWWVGVLGPRSTQKAPSVKSRADGSDEAARSDSVSTPRLGEARAGKKGKVSASGDGSEPPSPLSGMITKQNRKRVRNENSGEVTEESDVITPAGDLHIEGASQRSVSSAASVSTEDSEERRLWSQFPEQSRRHPPGLIALELEQRRLAEQRAASERRRGSRDGDGERIAPNSVANGALSQGIIPTFVLNSAIQEEDTDESEVDASNVLLPITEESWSITHETHSGETGSDTAGGMSRRDDEGGAAP